MMDPPPTSNDFSPTSIATAEFKLFGPITVYTSPNDDVSTAFAPVSADITNGELSLDLSSWTVWLNGTNINQEAVALLGILSAATSQLIRLSAVPPLQ